MGIHDRDYYHDRPSREFRLNSVVGGVILLNVVVWLFQVISIRSPLRLERYLGCNPVDVFEHYYLWQPLTANFLHTPLQIAHILMNMLFLFIFGRELEVLYGRRRFLIFYLTAGYVAISIQAAWNYWISPQNAQTTIFGASGAVMATVVLFTSHYPRQEIYLLFLIPLQAWILCAAFVMLDLVGAVSGSSPGETQVAFLAHLGGAAYGLLFRLYDVKVGWSPAGLFRTLGSLRRRSPKLKVLRRPSASQPVQPRPGQEGGETARDPVSLRIDQLLEKIHRSGRASLTAEELEYLQRNSGRYRSER
jgi:rhomboid family protein